MKKTFQILLLIIVSLSYCGCQKGEYPYITKEEAEQITTVQNPTVQNVAFVYNNDVYFAADIDKTPVKITNTGTVKKFVKASHDHTRFAYQNASDNIEIVDNTGKLITTLTYTNIKSFDWTADDKTLYILSNGNMYYYGTGLSLAITYPGVIAGYTTEVLSASVSAKGDFAYIIHASAYTYADIYKLVIKPAGSSSVITYDNSNSTYPMSYVNFSGNLQDMVVGYRELHSASYNYEKIEFFTSLNNRPSFTYESSQMYGTPVYNSTLNYMVCGFVDVNTSKVVLAAITLKDSHPSKVKSTYFSNGNGLYTDWK